MRFVVGPDGVIVPDISERLPGRGLWLSASRDIIGEACAKNVFAKAARGQVQVSVPDDLSDRVEQLLRQRCLEIIGLARRAGQMVGGYEKVRSYFKTETAGVLIAANDGAEDGRSKISALAPEIPLFDCFNGGELGAAIGRDRLVHAIITEGGFANSLLVEANKLVGLQKSSDPNV